MATAIVRAVVAHLYIAWIHPFGDGNGRTARLLEFEVLLRARVPTVAAHLLSSFYNETRTEYYRQLQRASESRGDIMPFLLYAIEGFVDSLKDQIGVVQREQMDVAWRNYVFGVFGHTTSESRIRQRQLVLDLSRVDKPVRRRELPDISPRVMRMYISKTPKTLTRDVNELKRMELLVVENGLCRARTEVIRAFLPGRAPAADCEDSGRRRAK
jgi:hypothetical protein